MTDKDEKEQDPGFRVTDRRMFTPEGEVREEEAKSDQPERGGRSEAEPPAGQAAPPASGSEREGGSDESEREDGEGSVNFASFLLSLGTTGMMHLGEIPEPTTGKAMENLEGARQMIDILTILKEKTRGNLSSDEERLIDGLLYELRMKFLAKSNVIKF